MPDQGGAIAALSIASRISRAARSVVRHAEHPGTTTSFNEEICYSNGAFIRLPDGAQQ